MHERGGVAVLIESAVISAKDSVENGEEIAGVSITDATDFVNESDVNSLAYWSCTGRKGIHDSFVYYCDYVERLKRSNPEESVPNMNLGAFVYPSFR